MFYMYTGTADELLTHGTVYWLTIKSIYLPEQPTEALMVNIGDVWSEIYMNYIEFQNEWSKINGRSDSIVQRRTADTGSKNSDTGKNG